MPAPALLFDALGRRVEKNVGGAKTEYINGIDGNVLAEVNGSNGGWQVGYVYLGGQLLAQYSGGTTYFAHKDHLGSTRVLTKIDATGYDNYDYLPFGELMSGGGGSINKFTGYEYDSESGNNFAQARYHSPRLGRFLSPDPDNAGANPMFPQTWNAYSYVVNNPLAAIDPTGRECVWGDGSFDSNDDSQTGNSTACGDAGGTWVDHSFFSDFGFGDWSGQRDAALQTLAFDIQSGWSLVNASPGWSGWVLNAPGSTIDWSLFGPVLPQPTLDQMHLLTLKLSGIEAKSYAVCSVRAGVANGIPFGGHLVGMGDAKSDAQDVATKAATHPFTTSKVLNGISMPNIGEQVVQGSKKILPVLKAVEKADPVIAAAGFAKDLTECTSHPPTEK